MQNDRQLLIGQLAKQAGVKSDTVRFYEKHKGFLRHLELWQRYISTAPKCLLRCVANISVVIPRMCYHLGTSPHQLHRRHEKR